jgi:primosomal protein N' (replication factor Y)
LKQRDFKLKKEGSMWLYQVLSQNLNMPVLGPEEPAISRIGMNTYRQSLLKYHKYIDSNHKKNYPKN